MKNKCCNKCFGEELLLSASAISSALSKKLDLDELELIAAFFTVLGDSLTLLSVQRSNYESNCITENDVSQNNKTKNTD